MKKVVLIVGFLLSVSIFASASGDLLGFWYMQKDLENRTPVTEIFEKEGKYYAYAFAFKDLEYSDEKDTNNPDEALRSRSMNGLVFIYDLEFKKDKWVNGWIYNPDDGKDYHIKGTLSKDKQTITWRVSVDGFGLFGKDIEWTRIDAPSQYMKFKPNLETIYPRIPVK